MAAISFLSLQGLVEGQRFPDHGLGLIEVLGTAVQVPQAGIVDSQGVLAVQGLVEGERLFERRLGLLELAADGIGQIIRGASAERGHVSRFSPQEGHAAGMHPAQVERGRGDGSLVAALVALHHRVLEARLGAGEIAAAQFQAAERDPGVGGPRIELFGIDLHGIDLHGIDLGGVEHLGLWQAPSAPRGLSARRRPLKRPVREFLAALVAGFGNGSHSGD